MERMKFGEAGTIRRMLVAACLIPVLAAGTTACATPEADGSGQAAADSGSDEGDGDGENADDLESLSSGELLSLGMTGDAAVRCDFERGDTIGTIYFNGPDRQRFDSLNPERAKAHIVLHDGRAHTWVHGTSEGVRYPEPGGYAGLVGEDPEDVKAHSSNCEPHHDLSVFDLPGGVTFVDLPVE